MGSTVAGLRQQIIDALIESDVEEARKNNQHHNTRNTELVLNLIRDLSTEDAPRRADAAIRVFQDWLQAQRVKSDVKEELIDLAGEDT